jgi:hypothetical protein
VLYVAIHQENRGTDWHLIDALYRDSMFAANYRRTFVDFSLLPTHQILSHLSTAPQLLRVFVTVVWMEESSLLHNPKSTHLLLTVFLSFEAWHWEHSKSANVRFQTSTIYPNLEAPCLPSFPTILLALIGVSPHLYPRLASGQLRGGVGPRQAAYTACTKLTDVPYNIPEFLFLTWSVPCAAGNPLMHI